MTLAGLLAWRAGRYGAFNQTLEQGMRKLDEIVGTIIENRRKSGEDRGDLLSMLMLAEDDSALAQDG